MLGKSNIAYVQGVSGTFVAPAHSPYDRQMLREHLERLVGPTAPATLGVHGTRWMISRGVAADVVCTECTGRLGRLSCNRSTTDDATCIDCAMQPERTKTAEGKRQ